MSSEALTWKLEQDICRCCLSEGSFQSLSETFCHSGQREIYSDMLRDVLDVNLFPVEGPLCTATYTICEGCVLQLRAACNFKKQVLYCEEKFKEMYSKNYIVLSDSKPTVVKEEVQDTCNDDDYFHVSDAEDHDGADDEPAFSFNSDNDDDAVPPAKQPKKLKPKPKEKPQKKAGKSKRRKKPASAEAESEPSAAEPKRKRGIRLDTPIKNYEGCFKIVEDEIYGKSFVCITCNKMYQSRTNVIQHNKFGHLKRRTNVILCNLCGMHVLAHSSAAHREKEHGIPAPTCSLCGKKFSFPHLVRHHHKTFHAREFVPRTSVKCPICEEIFKNSSQLNKHTRLKHSGSRMYQCHVCDEIFQAKYTLQRHLNHHEERTHKVALYKTSLQLQDHTKSKHSGPRMYQCNKCHKTYQAKSTLQRHLNDHEERKLNGALYKTSLQLQDHTQSKHSGPQIFKCNKCHKAFQAKSSLRRHLNQHEGRTHKGALYKTSLQLQDSQSKHNGLEMFKCNKCHKTYQAKYSLQRHLKRHEESTHKGAGCDAVFGIRSDLTHQ